MCYLGNKMIKRLETLVVEVLGFGILIDSGGCVLIGIKVGIGITKIVTWIYKELGQHIKLSKIRLS